MATSGPRLVSKTCNIPTISSGETSTSNPHLVGAQASCWSQRRCRRRRRPRPRRRSMTSMRSNMRPKSQRLRQQMLRYTNRLTVTLLCPWLSEILRTCAVMYGAGRPRASGTYSSRFYCARCEVYIQCNGVVAKM